MREGRKFFPHATAFTAGAIVFITTLRYYSMRYRKVAMNIFHVIRRLGVCEKLNVANNERPTPLLRAVARYPLNAAVFFFTRFITLLKRFLRKSGCNID